MLSRERRFGRSAIIDRNDNCAGGARQAPRTAGVDLRVRQDPASAMEVQDDGELPLRPTRLDQQSVQRSSGSAYTDILFGSPWWRSCRSALRGQHGVHPVGERWLLPGGLRIKSMVRTCHQTLGQGVEHALVVKINGGATVGNAGLTFRCRARDWLRRSPFDAKQRGGRKQGCGRDEACSGWIGHAQAPS